MTGLPSARSVKIVERERGAVLPLMALLLVALLAMSAIVVDLGVARETRRRNQSAVDAVALGAAQDLPDPLDKLVPSTLTSLALSNFGFAPDLNSCATSPDPSPLPIQEPGYNCVTFDAGKSEIRVYYPGLYQTAFGQVIGANTLKIGTGATATKAATSGFGGILPFGIPTGAGAGEICLKTSGSGTAVGACNAGPTSGNFNYLDVAQYGNAALKTPQRCSTGNKNNMFQDNVAIGVDHLLTDYPSLKSTVQDAYITCPTYTPGPDQLATETGNVSSLTTPALLTDVKGSTSIVSDHGGARMQRGIFVCPVPGQNLWAGWGPGLSTSYSCGSVEGVAVDDVPLWYFIGSGGSHSLATDIPASCQYSVFALQLLGDKTTGAAQRAQDMRGRLDTCFSDYEAGSKAGCSATPCSGNLFAYKSGICTSNGGKRVLFDIQCTPRFGYTPVVCAIYTGAKCTSTYPSGGSGNVWIDSRQPVFLQRLTDSTAADLETADNKDSLDYEPGVAYTNTKGHSITNIIAYAFDRNMLPPPLGDPSAPNQTDANVFVSLLR